MFLVFGKCPFLSRWKNVLSVSHALHLCFIWNKSVTRTVISVNHHLLSDTYPVNMRFYRYLSGTLAVIAWLMGSTHRSRELRAAEEINFVIV